MKLPGINQIILFQFEKADKWRIYRAIKENGINIKLLRHDMYILGIYMPPKKLESGDVFIDYDLLNMYTNFIASLNKRQISYFQTIYNKSHTLTENGEIPKKTIKILLSG